MEELQALGVRQRLEAPPALDQHLHLEEGQRLEEGPHFRTSLDPLKTQGVEVVDLLGNYTACDIHDICKSGFSYSFFNFEYNVLASTILFVLVLHLVPPQPLEVWLKEAVLLPHLAVCHKGVVGLVDLEQLVEGEEGLEELVQVTLID